MQYLSVSEEEGLVRYLCENVTTDFPVRNNSLRSLALNIAHQRSTMDGSLNRSKLPGINWPRAFIKRHPEVRQRVKTNRKAMNAWEKTPAKNSIDTSTNVRLLESLNLDLSSRLSATSSDQTVWQTPAGRLDRFFQKGPGKYHSYTDSEIITIASLLRQTHLRWSTVPRTYIVLRAIGHLNLLDTLLDADFSDFWFPVTEQCLSGCLGPSVGQALFNAQHIILTTSMELEKGAKGEHCYFKQGDPFPFESKKALGEGGMGQVDRVLHKISSKEYARKRVPRSSVFKGPWKERMKRFVDEIQILKRLEHRHIVEFVGSYTDDRDIGLIMLPVAEMDLGDYLLRCTISSHPELRTFFGCLATALDFLHSQKVRHKHIKPRNILVDRGQVFVTDFGLSLDFTDESGGTTTGMVNGMTPRYCAPEVAEYEPRNEASDIWSLGLVFLEMTVVLKGKVAGDMDEFFKQNGTRRAFVYANMSALPPFFAELENEGDKSDNAVLGWVREMLCVQPHLRLTASALVTSILESASFCGSCCLNSEEDYSDCMEE